MNLLCDGGDDSDMGGTEGREVLAAQTLFDAFRDGALEFTLLDDIYHVATPDGALDQTH